MSRNSLQISKFLVAGLPGCICFCKSNSGELLRVIPLICKFFDTLLDNELRIYLESLGLGSVLSLKTFKVSSLEEIINDNPTSMKGVSSFRLRLYKELKRVEKGSTITYSELGRRSGFHRHSRAVARAMKDNPFPIIIPCHRVCSKNGDDKYSITCLKHKPYECNVSDVYRCSSSIKKTLRLFEGAR